jgi:predicted dinucleotide-binding enzyme
MKIGIIGAGAIGGTLTRRLTSLGHEVFVANSRGAATLKDLAAETGATAVYTREAARIGEIVIITIPQGRVTELPKDIFWDAPRDTVIVDTGNYYPQQRDGRIALIERGLTESQWVAQQIGRPVIKAFNNIYWKHLLGKGAPPGANERIALPVSGDDAIAKSVILDLIDALGFDAVDAGPLKESWRQQPGTPAYGTDLDAQNLRHALSIADPRRKPEWQALEEDAFDLEHSG